MRTRLNRRAIVLLIGALVIAALAVVVLVTSPPSPDQRLKAAVETLARRQTTALIADSAGLARTTGLAFVPAGINMAVTDWQATPNGDTLMTAWTVVATGNGATWTTSMRATFQRRGEVFTWADAEGYLRPTNLVAPVATRDAAQHLVTETDRANAAFGTRATLAVEVVGDPAAPVPSPITTVDPELLAGARSVETRPVVPATAEQTYLVVGNARYLVYEQRRSAEPAHQIVGGLQPADLTGPAHEALMRFLAAKEAGNVAEAARYLSNAEGLTASGLAASTITNVPVEALRPVGERGAYAVMAGDRRITGPDKDGRWKVDYTRQPLAVVTFGGPTVGTGEPYVPDGHERPFAWQRALTLERLTVLAGAGTARLTVTGEIFFEGRGFVESLYLASVTLDGRASGVGTPIICRVPIERECVIEISVPPGGVRTVVVSIGLGQRDAPTLYGTAEFTGTAE